MLILKKVKSNQYYGKHLSLQIGLDNVLNDLITPTPKYQRFEQPLFNPVLEHPEHDSETADEDCEHFVIRIDIKPDHSENTRFI